MSVDYFTQKQQDWDQYRKGWIDSFFDDAESLVIGGVGLAEAVAAAVNQKGFYAQGESRPESFVSGVTDFHGDDEIFILLDDDGSVSYTTGSGINTSRYNSSPREFLNTVAEYLFDVFHPDEEEDNGY